MFQKKKKYEGRNKGACSNVGYCALCRVDGKPAFTTEDYYSALSPGHLWAPMVLLSHHPPPYQLAAAQSTYSKPTGMPHEAMCTN